MRRPPRPPYRSSGARRLGGAGLAVLLLAGSLALTPGASAEEEGAAPEAPFGDQIEPGTSFTETAEVTTGTYAFTIPEPGQDHYFEVLRTEPGEVIWYGVTAQVGEPGDYQSINVQGTAEGDSTRECDDGALVGLDGRSFVTTLANANRSAECRDAESITITVGNAELADESLPTDAYYQLVIWTEPPVEDTRTLPSPNENSTWSPMTAAEGEPTEVTGATSFTEAEPLADGTYRTTLERGTTAIFAFPMTFGQHAQVEATVGDGDSFNGGSTLDPVWVSPLGGELRTVEASGGPPSGLSVSGSTPAGWATPIVTYNNRQRTGGVGASRGGGFGSTVAAPAAFAGTYFLALEIPSGELNEDSYRDEMTIDMNVATVTDYEAGPPEYVEEPTALSALDGSGYVATAEEEQAAQSAGAEDAPWLLVAGLFGGAALLAAVGGVAVGRVLRSRS